MKTKLMFVLAAAACCTLSVPAYGQEAAPAAVADVASPHVRHMQDMIVLVDEMIAVIDSVKDRASADAAAARIPEIMRKLAEISQAVEALGTPSPELQEQFQMMTFEVVGRFIAIAGKTEKLRQADFYGSAALRELADRKEPVPGE